MSFLFGLLAGIVITSISLHWMRASADLSISQERREWLLTLRKVNDPQQDKADWWKRGTYDES